MNNILLINLIIGIFFFLTLFIASVISFAEHEKRAAFRFFVLSLIAFGCLFISYFIQYQYSVLFSSILFFTILFTVIILVVPYRGKIQNSHEKPGGRLDERNTMFSRRELVKDTEKYSSYYTKYPGKEIIDNNFLNF